MNYYEISLSPKIGNGDGDVSAHNLSSTAHVDIRKILNDSIILPKYNSVDYTLEFETHDGKKLSVKLPIQQMNLQYDEVSKKIYFLNEDGVEVRIPVEDFIQVYIGSVGENIQIEVVSGNKIQATILDNGINWNKLSLEIQQKITNLETLVSKKQNKLVAGANISINPVTNEISSLGGSFIDDNKTEKSSTWSSYKISAELGKKISLNESGKINASQINTEELKPLVTPKWEGISK